MRDSCITVLFLLFFVLMLRDNPLLIVVFVAIYFLYRFFFRQKSHQEDTTQFNRAMWQQMVSIGVSLKSIAETLQEMKKESGPWDYSGSGHNSLYDDEIPDEEMDLHTQVGGSLQ